MDDTELSQSLNDAIQRLTEFEEAKNKYEAVKSISDSHERLFKSSMALHDKYDALWEKYKNLRDEYSRICQENMDLKKKLNQ